MGRNQSKDSAPFLHVRDRLGRNLCTSNFLHDFRKRYRVPSQYDLCVPVRGRVDHLRPVARRTKQAQTRARGHRDRECLCIGSNDHRAIETLHLRRGNASIERMAERCVVTELHPGRSPYLGRCESAGFVCSASFRDGSRTEALFFTMPMALACISQKNVLCERNNWVFSSFYRIAGCFVVSHLKPHTDTITKVQESEPQKSQAWHSKNLASTMSASSGHDEPHK